MTLLTIRHFTDPGCPWAFSSEPKRLRLAWLFGDQLRWEHHMVVLTERPEDNEAKGVTPESLVASFGSMQRRFGMPIDNIERPHVLVSVASCRAVVAARLGWPEREAALLRALRVRYFAGEMIDDPAAVAAAAESVGLDPHALRLRSEDTDVEQALRADMAAARNPSPAALALDHRLADAVPGHTEGRRYTCPSLEIETTRGGRFDVPGFQPWETYETALANLAPELERRPPPESVEAALAWAGEPLATAEVAALCELRAGDARQELARVADEHPIGPDGYWTLRG